MYEPLYYRHNNTGTRTHARAFSAPPNICLITCRQSAPRGRLPLPHRSCHTPPQVCACIGRESRARASSHHRATTVFLQHWFLRSAWGMPKLGTGYHNPLPCALCRLSAVNRCQGYGELQHPCLTQHLQTSAWNNTGHRWQNPHLWILQYRELPCSHTPRHHGNPLPLVPKPPPTHLQQSVCLQSQGVSSPVIPQTPQFCHQVPWTQYGYCLS